MSISPAPNRWPLPARQALSHAGLDAVAAAHDDARAYQTLRDSERSISPRQAELYRQLLGLLTAECRTLSDALEARHLAVPVVDELMRLEQIEDSRALEAADFARRSGRIDVEITRAVEVALGKRRRAQEVAL